ncbi:hypothetical protein O3P69_012317 [Scylla paramamosain]|uniref:Uncharacterized protein n=1 Tax=Scylla paramamosain TaxID=85552 RepID=A0AAW0TDI5_SCYPA
MKTGTPRDRSAAMARLLLLPLKYTVLAHGTSRWTFSHPPVSCPIHSLNIIDIPTVIPTCMDPPLPTPAANSALAPALTSAPTSAPESAPILSRHPYWTPTLQTQETPLVDTNLTDPVDTPTGHQPYRLSGHL